MDKREIINEIVSELETDGVLDAEPAEKLKPCPFCNGEAAIVTDPMRVRHAGACLRSSCFIRLPWEDSEADAIAAWNRRAEPAAHEVTAERFNKWLREEHERSQRITTFEVTPPEASLSAPTKEGNDV